MFLHKDYLGFNTVLKAQDTSETTCKKWILLIRAHVFCDELAFGGGPRGLDVGVT